MDYQREVVCRPVPDRLSQWRRLRVLILGGSWCCQHCGAWFVPCHKADVDPLFPTPQNGYCCPDGHEGYVDRLSYGGIVRERFDRVADQEEV